MKKKRALIISLSIILVLVMALVALAIANRINEKKLNEYIDSIAPVELADRLTPSKDGYGYYRFKTDRDLRIMQLTDIHIGGGVFFNRTDKLAIAAVAELVSREKPDLVVVTGDISFAIPTTGTFDNGYAHRLFIRLMERLGVNWTVTFGNHDSEGYNFLNRAAVAKMYEDSSLEYCLFSAGPEHIYGKSNHIINVENSDGLITESIVMLDSNAYKGIDIFGIFQNYDKVHDDQIDWYRSTISMYNEDNKRVYEGLKHAEGEPETAPTIKSLLFMHIPMEELGTAYSEYVNNGRQDTSDSKFLGGIDGENGRVVYCSEEPTELFETMLALGSTEAAFFGHDHFNNFVMEYKGIKLSYGYSVDYCAYGDIGNKTEQRGCTIITVSRTAETTIEHKRLLEE